MSTRSRIGMVQEDGSVKSIYCHFDGYPSGVGATLKENYTDPEKVKELIELGDISSLDEDIESTIAYHRDRGEDKSIDTCYTGRGWITRVSQVSYGYLFEDGKWKTYR